MGSSLGRQPPPVRASNHQQTGSGQVLNNLKFHVSPTAAWIQPPSEVLTDIFYSSWSADFPHRAHGLLTGSAGVTSITAIYTCLRYRFGEREAAIGKPGQYSLIPYAGLRVDQCPAGHRRAAQQRSSRPRRIERQGSLDAPGWQAPDRTQASLFFPAAEEFSPG